MDRRQKKTRDAIFGAFTALLSEKHYSHITVQDIIDTADIGRTTFYAHFETKEFLLKELCEELFAHIVDAAMGLPHGHHHDFCDRTGNSVFLHLLGHLQENDLHILELLASENNELFLQYFKENLKKLVISQYAEGGRLDHSRLPKDFLVDHISASFVETVRWWLSRGMREKPETVTDYFLATVEPLLNESSV